MGKTAQIRVAKTKLALEQRIAELEARVAALESLFSGPPANIQHGFPLPLRMGSDDAGWPLPPTITCGSEVPLPDTHALEFPPPSITRA
jgi:hypothetical protein